MGVKNYLIEGISCTGKTSICHELRRRGYHALNTDRDLACKGDPETGMPLDQPAGLDEKAAIAWVHKHQIWDIDRDTLKQRLALRPEDEFGGKPAERDFILALHASKEDIPRNGIIIDATAPVDDVADQILQSCIRVLGPGHEPGSLA